MLPVEPVSYRAFIDLIEYPVCVLEFRIAYILHCCCEDDDLVECTHLDEELLRVRSDSVPAFTFIFKVVDQGLVQI